MSVLRTTSTARLIALRAPAAMFVRNYSPDTRAEGATASSTSFKEREQASETKYVKEHEAAKLKAAREKLAQAQAEVDKQQKIVDGQK
ncbi:hypothetical protein I203_100760 [Kwoniella mangroviensis CBS 8507]|uniref:uncharacterized protein n=1 Tax=Kwoniella mangroviensis CBS 8507 TaxID=1296122 RepID=UPI00080D8490|nr:uncharacterized protein I203_06708 [Kwoniella mangroviensis CBS 8507]OCF64124.1 hypothetical protein I203_06708 [Kwoniella mangroviensis CBS 8507]